LTQPLRKSLKTTGNDNPAGRRVSRSSLSISPLYEKHPSTKYNKSRKIYENRWTNSWIKQLQETIYKVFAATS